MTLCDREGGLAYIYTWEALGHWLRQDFTSDDFDVCVQRPGEGTIASPWLPGIHAVAIGRVTVAIGYNWRRVRRMEASTMIS